MDPNSVCTKCGLKPVNLPVTDYDSSTIITVLIDACIAPMVAALNNAGIPASESCCGHGKEDGTIFLQDGRILVIKKGKTMTDAEKILEQEDLLELAWGVIANANGGNWDEATPEWKAAAEKWRDRWHIQLQWNKRLDHSIDVK